MTLELVMNFVGFLAGINWDLCTPQVFSPNMHWSASTTSTPVSRCIFLMQGKAHDFAWAGFSCTNSLPACTCFL